MFLVRFIQVLKISIFKSVLIIVFYSIKNYKKKGFYRVIFVSFENGFDIR